MPHMVEMIGAPFDLCGPTLGGRLGPMALRLGKIADAFARIGVPFIDSGDALPLGAAVPGDYAQVLEHAQAAYRLIKAQTRQSIDRGNIPLVVGGDHSTSIGSISGAIEAYGSEGFSVLWIDAHMDINTPATSPSGNLHGMPLAALCRMDAGELVDQTHHEAWDMWSTLLGEIVPNPGLDVSSIAWLALRDVDAGEARTYRSLCKQDMALTMQDIDRDGVVGALDRIDHWLVSRKSKRLWISLDVDAFDPILAPGTGTRVRGGLSYREGHLVAELLHEMLHKHAKPYELAGMDVVEVNPLKDQAGETGVVALEWLLSMFGKTIMGFD